MGTCSIFRRFDIPKVFYSEYTAGPDRASVSDASAVGCPVLRISERSRASEHSRV